MNDYNLAEISKKLNIDLFSGLPNDPEKADMVIIGYLEKNLNRVGNLITFLTKSAHYIPQDKWIEYFIRCSKYVCSHESYKNLIAQAEGIIDEKPMKSSKLSEKIFSSLEELYISKNQIFADSNLLKRAADNAYVVSNDARYKLFRDYAFVYTSNDNSELTDAVKDLEIYLNSSDCGRDKRNIFYLQCLALMRIIRTEKPYELSETKFDDAYRNCVCPESPTEPWPYDYDDDDFDPYDEDNDKYFDFESMRTCYDLFSKIEKYNCPEVARFFENSDMYVETDFYRNLHKTVKRTVDNHKYSSERSPIVSRKIVFLSKPMIDPDFSPW